MDNLISTDPSPVTVHRFVLFCLVSFFFFKKEKGTTILMTSKDSFLPEAEIIRSVPPSLCLFCGVDPGELFSWSVGGVKRSKQTIKKGPRRWCL
jgi:sorbitol-specific phosphotransferase system component IIC